MLAFLAVLINAVAIVAGSVIGLFVRKKMSNSFKEIVFIGNGLTTLVSGIAAAIKTQNTLIMVFSVLLGGFLGYLIGIEDLVLALGNKISKPKPGQTNSDFSIGFLQASVLFCSGAMAILGPINSVMSGDASLVYLKSVMDGFMAIIFTAQFGLGVMASAATVFVYQSVFALLGRFIGPWLGDAAINELSAVGGVALIMIGLSLTDIKKFKTGNFVPAIFIAPLLYKLFELF